MEKSKKILIIGGYGFKNIGDEAILSGLLKTLNSDNSVEIIVFSYNPSETTKIHNIRAEKKNLRHFIVSDEIIIGGGELFQDGMAWKNSFAIILAKLLRKRVRVLGIGIDINNKIEKFLTKLAFKFVDEITVRDKRSFRKLINIGISASKIKLVKDYAFYLIPSATEKIKNFYSSYLSGYKFIVIVLRPKNQEINRKLLSFFINFITYLLQKDSNLKIVLLPFSKHPYSLKDNDMLILKRIKNNIKNRCFILFDEDLKPEEVLWLISKAELVISTRLHPLIFAKIVGTNAIAIPLFPKIRSFAEEYEYPIIEVSKLYEIIPKIISFGR